MYIFQILVYGDMVVTLALPSIIIIFFMIAISVSLVRSLKRQSRLKVTVLSLMIDLSLALVFLRLSLPARFLSVRPSVCPRVFYLSACLSVYLFLCHVENLLSISLSRLPLSFQNVVL